jgi:hypothetical protein
MASRKPSCNQNWKPSNLARIAVEETFRGTSSPRVTVPVMIKSCFPPSDCLNTRTTAVSTPGSVSNSSSRMAIASRSACSAAFASLTCGGRPRSQSSKGLAIHSHSATTPRHSTRSNRSGARESSPNRICRCTARPKSAIPHNSRISSPLNAFSRPIETQARKWNGSRSRFGRHKSDQAPFRAYSSARRRALCRDWLDTASCPRRTIQVEVRHEALPFIGERKR